MYKMLYVWNFVQSQRISYAIYMKTDVTEQILFKPINSITERQI